MDQDLQNDYKLTLAHDLIFFILNVHNNGLSKEQKVRTTNMILEAWEKRIDKNLKLIAEENIKQISEATGDGMDVLEIMQKIHSFEFALIRKDFKREVRHIASNEEAAKK